MHTYYYQRIHLSRLFRYSLLSCTVALLCLGTKAMGTDTVLAITSPGGVEATAQEAKSELAKTHEVLENNKSSAHASKSHNSKKKIARIYKGEVEIDAAISKAETPFEQINLLSSQAYFKSAANVPHSRNKILKIARDMAQYATTYKGFESSSEAADIILNEKNKLKSTAACEYAKQKKYDTLHSEVTTCILQIAMGLGMDEISRREQLIKSGILKLTELVGEQEAQNALNQLTTWSNQVKSENRIISHEVCDVLEIQNKFSQILSKAIQDDKVVNTISSRLHKYNRHSNLSRVASKVINTSLSLAALTPTIVSPAAQVTQFCYVAATGGPEEAKLLKEVYLDRRLEERWRRLNQEASLALNNYNLATLTGNPVLLACTESIIKGMIGNEAAGSLLPNLSSKVAVSQ